MFSIFNYYKYYSEESAHIITSLDKFFKLELLDQN